MMTAITAYFFDTIARKGSNGDKLAEGILAIMMLVCLAIALLQDIGLLLLLWRLG